MRKFIFFFIFNLTCFSLFAQVDINRIAPGAIDKFTELLNKPAMVKPATATPLGKNWFTLETDCHIFTDQVSLKQVVAVLLDIENQPEYFNGKLSKLQISNINRSGNEISADFVSIAMAGPFQLKTPYKASVRITLNSDTQFAVSIIQLANNSASNTGMKNMQAPRYAEEVTINGKKYTYIRMYAIEDINASILPGAKGTLEKNSFPANQEAMNMLIAAAKTKP
ncbi:MAG: hypothetical protein LBB81_11575 [Treponema sp.]|nr:hypothetical protein [Treponema sp.]